MTRREARVPECRPEMRKCLIRMAECPGKQGTDPVFNGPGVRGMLRTAESKGWASYDRTGGWKLTPTGEEMAVYFAQSREDNAASVLGRRPRLIASASDIRRQREESEP